MELGSHLAAHVLCRNRGDRDVSNAQLEGVRVLGMACTRPLHRARMSISPQPVEATGKTGIKTVAGFTCRLPASHMICSRVLCRVRCFPSK